MCLLVLMTAGAATVGHAQCTPLSDVFYGDTLPNDGCGLFATYSNVPLGSYVRMPVLSGADYTVSTCGAAYDTQITGFMGSDLNTWFVYNDDNGPVCSGPQASVTFTANATDYSRYNVNEYNCAAYSPSSPEITVSVRQNQNLAFTSSDAAMCAGDVRLLTAVPTPVTGIQPGSGEPGTFSGTGVSDATFTAPTPPGDSGVYNLGYAFGYCSTAIGILVYRRPDTVSAGPDQVVCGATGRALSGSSPVVGVGQWTGPAGVTFSPSAAIPTAVPSGLAVGENVLTWTVSNGPCSSSDTVTVTRRPDAVTVTSSSDTGGGSLRAALATICPGGTIGFDQGLAGSTVFVGDHGELAVSSAVTIDASSLSRRPVLNASGISRILAVGPGAQVTVDSVDMVGGGAIEGGAIYNSGTLQLSRSTVWNSVTAGSGARGGAIYNAPAANLVLSFSTVADSATSGQGGAIFVDAGGDVTVYNSTLSGNSTGPSGLGGAIYADSATVRFYDSTVVENSAGLAGGGLYVAGASGVTAVANTVIAANSAGLDGSDVYATIDASTNSLIGNGSGSAGWGPSDVVGTPAAPIDPRLNRLKTLGAGFRVHQPLPGSPVIDAGSCQGGSVTVDQRGVARPFDDPLVDNIVDGCDVGAVESRSPLFFDDFETGNTSAWSNGTP